MSARIVGEQRPIHTTAQEDKLSLGNSAHHTIHSMKVSIMNPFKRFAMTHLSGKNRRPRKNKTQKQLIEISSQRVEATKIIVDKPNRRDSPAKPQQPSTGNR
jgi:hypothetical protein